MTQSIGRFVLFALVFAAVASGGAAAGTRATDCSAVPRLDAGEPGRETPGDPQAKGRYKKDGNSCVWDANDSGPNQCTPQTAGRFKKNGASCVWDASDRGPDQCAPAKGRFKKDGNQCVWDASDSGPNQCDPRQPR